MQDQIVARIEPGDEHASNLLFRQYWVRLCTFTNKFLNDPEEAQEIVQEVFTKIWDYYIK